MDAGATVGRPPKKPEQKFDKRCVTTFNAAQYERVMDHLEETGESWMEFSRRVILDAVESNSRSNNSDSE